MGHGGEKGKHLVGEDDDRMGNLWALVKLFVAPTPQLYLGQGLGNTGEEADDKRRTMGLWYFMGILK